MPHLCPLCATDDHTTSRRTKDGVRFVVCADSSHGDDGFVWEPSPPGRSRRGDGLGAELGIWNKLLELLDPAEDFVPYGVVEDRLFEQYPNDARLLLHRYGHKFRDPEHPSTQYSMSAYLASRLRELHQEGALELRWDAATGPWEHNGVISHWRLARTANDGQ
jgi:hypothetical protein